MIIHRDWFSSQGQRITSFELILVIILVTFMTASPWEFLFPPGIILIKIAGYGLTLGIILKISWSIRHELQVALKHFFPSYKSTLIYPLALYFLGLIIGAFSGPDTDYALWQTFSDLVVFLFAFLAFGWLVQDLNKAVYRLMQVVAVWSTVLFPLSLIAFIGNLNGWWSINVFLWYGRMLMAGPFTHANHLGYLLMMGSFSAATLAIREEGHVDWKWVGVSLFTAVGVAVTFGRGAMLGTAVALIGITAIRSRRLAILLTLGAILAITFFIYVALYDIPMPSFIPKTGFSFRSDLWGMAISNVKEYGPLGVGAGQAESLPGVTTHNFWLEQYGEGGILTVLGVLSWLVLPIINLRKSRLNRTLAWSIVAAMAGLMVHGIFWSQTLNGLRILTLVYVCLWTALGTSRVGLGTSSNEKIESHVAPQP